MIPFNVSVTLEQFMVFLEEFITQIFHNVGIW